jgi:hypothetical protein
VLAVAELQLSVAVCGDDPKVKVLPGLIAPQLRLGGAVKVSVTCPVKPFRAAIVIVEVTDCPGAATGDVAEMKKLGDSARITTEFEYCSET